MAIETSDIYELLRGVITNDIVNVGFTQANEQSLRNLTAAISKAIEENRTARIVRTQETTKTNNGIILLNSKGTELKNETTKHIEATKETTEATKESTKVTSENLEHAKETLEHQKKALTIQKENAEKLKNSNSKLIRVMAAYVESTDHVSNDEKERMRTYLGKIQNFSDSWSQWSVVFKGITEAISTLIGNTNQRLGWLLDLEAAGIRLAGGFDEVLTEFANNTGMATQDFVGVMANNSKQWATLNSYGYEFMSNYTKSLGNITGKFATTGKEALDIFGFYNDTILTLSSNEEVRNRNIMSETEALTKNMKELSVVTGKSVQTLIEEQRLKEKNLLHLKIASDPRARTLQQLMPGAPIEVIESIITGRPSEKTAQFLVNPANRQMFQQFQGMYKRMMADDPRRKDFMKDYATRSNQIREVAGAMLTADVNRMSVGEASILQNAVQGQAMLAGLDATRVRLNVESLDKKHQEEIEATDAMIEARKKANEKENTRMESFSLGLGVATGALWAFSAALSVQTALLGLPGAGLFVGASTALKGMRKLSLPSIIGQKIMDKVYDLAFSGFKFNNGEGKLKFGARVLKNLGVNTAKWAAGLPKWLGGLVFRWLKKPFGWLGTAIKWTGSGLWKSAKWFGSGLGKLVKGFGSGLGNVLKSLGSNLLSVTKGVGHGLASMLGTLGTGLKAMMGSVLHGVGIVLKGLMTFQGLMLGAGAALFAFENKITSFLADKNESPVAYGASKVFINAIGGGMAGMMLGPYGMIVGAILGAIWGGIETYLDFQETEKDTQGNVITSNLPTEGSVQTILTSQERYIQNSTVAMESKTEELDLLRTIAGATTETSYTSQRRLERDQLSGTPMLAIEGV